MSSPTIYGDSCTLDIWVVKYVWNRIDCTRNPLKMIKKHGFLKCECSFDPNDLNDNFFLATKFEREKKSQWNFNTIHWIHKFLVFTGWKSHNIMRACNDAINSNKFLPIKSIQSLDHSSVEKIIVQRNRKFSKLLANYKMPVLNYINIWVSFFSCCFRSIKWTVEGSKNLLIVWFILGTHSIFVLVSHP